MKHSSSKLAGWPQLTPGFPSALYESPQSVYTGNHIAAMQNLASGIIAPSTLHLYIDLFNFLSTKKITVFIDEKIYAVSKFGIESLMVNKIPVYTFKHFDADDLLKNVKQKTKFTTPIVFTDGLCPACGKVAPVNDYATIVQQHSGIIIIDDTQAFGILGSGKDSFIYGYGGGGILRWLNVPAENIVTIVSLAKAFGAPVAVISGSQNFTAAFKQESKTRESSSPVSNAHLNAATNAININQKTGDHKRKQLLTNILLLKHDMENSGLRLSAGLFPVQSIVNLSLSETNYLFNKLAEYSFKTVLTKRHMDEKPVLTCIINCGHSKSQIHSFTNAIKTIIASRSFLMAS